MTNTCHICNKSKQPHDFVPSYSPFHPSGRTSLCYDCAKTMVDPTDLNQVDRWCQFANMAFLPDEWRKLYRQYGDSAFQRYAESYHGINYYKYDWGEQNQKIIEIATKGLVDLELEELTDAKYAELSRVWGGTFSHAELIQLEELFNSSLQDYTVSAATDRDMLRKVCKLSLMVDKDFAGGRVDAAKLKQYESLLASLQKAVEKNETGGITSLGQILAFVERNGYKPSFYDGIPRDELDMMEQNIKEHISDTVTSAVNISEIYEQRKRALSKRGKAIEDLDTGDEDEEEYEDDE